MEVAIVGPVCKDVNRYQGREEILPGGVTYYAGLTFKSLGDKIKVYGSCDSEDVEWASGLGFEFIHTGGRGTMTFENIYFDPKNPNSRTQKIGTPNSVTLDDIPLNSLAGLDYLVFGPLSFDNIFASTIDKFHDTLRNTRTDIALLPQGMIRYTEGGSTANKSPENVLRTLPYIDHIFLDDEQLQFISGEDRVEYGARRLQRMGVKNVIVTLGSEGSQLFLGSDSAYKINAFKPRKIVDATGSGDTFSAAWLSSKEIFFDPVDQGRFAAMAATMGLEKRGAFNSSRKQVLNRLKREK